MNKEDSDNLKEIRALLEENNTMISFYIKKKLALEARWALNENEKFDYVGDSQRELSRMFDEFWERQGNKKLPVVKPLSRKEQIELEVQLKEAKWQLDMERKAHQKNKGEKG
jgi:hypothetical protein